MSFQHNDTGGVGKLIAAGGLATGFSALLAAYTTFNTVLPLVPVAGWEWLIAGIIAVLAGYIAAQLMWFLIVVVFIGLL